MEEVMRWRNYFARSRQVKKSSDWVTFPFYHDQEPASFDLIQPHLSIPLIDLSHLGLSSMRPIKADDDECSVQ